MVRLEIKGRQKDILLLINGKEAFKVVIAQKRKLINKI